MKCLHEVYGESAVATPDGKAERRRRRIHVIIQFVLLHQRIITRINIRAILK